jgi:hypothetical protein
MKQKKIDNVVNVDVRVEIGPLNGYARHLLETKQRELIYRAEYKA